MKPLLAVLALSLLLVEPAPCQANPADTSTRLEWTDLVPRRASVDNPFAALSEADRSDLRLVIRERDSARLGMALSDAAKADAAAAARRLQDRKLDAAKLLAERDRLMRERDQQTKGMVTELAGKTISLAGYMLPLEFKGDKVSEFLLVPWVGACIHTPPPPPNQIVYVRPAEPVDGKGRFAPVWVTGPLQVQPGQRNLQMSDGAAPVDTGYSVSGAIVKPYEKP